MVNKLLPVFGIRHHTVLKKQLLTTINYLFIHMIIHMFLKVVRANVHMEGKIDVNVNDDKNESHLEMILSKFLTPSVNRLIDHIAQNVGQPITAAELQALPMRAYLEYSVVPVLVCGLQSLIEEKPPKPIEYLAAFLMKNRRYPKEETGK
ncbi:hypothetical protein D915_005569 [Fasciola hepatica]|uniref:Dpy-30 motif protein n=1 Tax=Fasciola hepatica TaxID=6192 RepID=A0A4E0RQR1_FASHE|nr:hypothetical protein D915_005569 [Fasciola hepatica]